MNKDPRTKEEILKDQQEAWQEARNVRYKYDQFREELRHILDCGDSDPSVLKEKARATKSDLEQERSRRDTSAHALGVENAKLWHMIRVLTNDPDVQKTDRENQEDVFERTDPTNGHADGLQSMRGI